MVRKYKATKRGPQNKWSPDSMQQAIAALKSGEITSFREAQKRFNSNILQWRSQGVCTPRDKPAVCRRQLETDEYYDNFDDVRDDEDSDVDDEYYDVRRDEPYIARTVRTKVNGVISFISTLILYPMKLCRDVITICGETCCKIRRDTICILNKSMICIRNLPQYAFERCRNVLSSVLLRVTSSGRYGVKRVIGDNVGSWKAMGAELAHKASNHLPTLPGKYLVDTVSDIIANTHAIRREVSDPLRGPLNMRTDYPVVLDRIALAAFRAGNWFLGLRSTVEEETMFVDNYHDHLDRMQRRSRNIDYSCTLDEIRTPDQSPTLIGSPTQISGLHLELRERRSTVL